MGFERLKLSPKKLLFLTGALLLLFFIAGFLYYYLFWETPVEEWGKLPTLDSNEYILLNKEGESLLSTKSSLFELVVPNRWKMARYPGIISLTSPDFEYNNDSPNYPLKGCRWTFQVSYGKISLQNLKKALLLYEDEAIEQRIIETGSINSLPYVLVNLKVPSIKREINRFVFPRKQFFSKSYIFSVETDVHQDYSSQCLQLLRKSLTTLRLK